MAYVDGYLLPVPKKNVAAYKKMATMGCKVWMDHGALDYRECIGEDLKSKWGIPFPKQMKLKASETVAFSWIVFKSKAHRNKVNAAVMKDARIAGMMNMKKMPFDPKRMCYGGFTSIVAK
ncbi:MAG: DUF1428 domain-containing protein [Phycisphaerales bacterium]